MAYKAQYYPGPDSISSNRIKHLSGTSGLSEEYIEKIIRKARNRIDSSNHSTRLTERDIPNVTTDNTSKKEGEKKHKTEKAIRRVAEEKKKRWIQPKDSLLY
jgi:methyl coenzyme M reductase gamma subunit